MRKLLNTLYVTTPDAYLSKDGQNVVVSIDSQERFRIPCVNIEAIVTFGYTGASPGLMKLCADQGIALTFLSPTGRYIGRFQGPVHGNVLLRRRQYAVTDNPSLSLHIASLMIAGKILNYRAAVQRCLRDHADHGDDILQNAVESLHTYKRRALSATDPATLRGFEGAASNLWFTCFPRLLTAQTDAFLFTGRNRRPPRDPLNAMLSFAYTLLASDCTAALETVGLDPCVGFFHTVRPGRASLALDLMEEMRSFLCDRFVITLINRRQITLRHFQTQTIETPADTAQAQNMGTSSSFSPSPRTSGVSGTWGQKVVASVILTEDGRREFIKAWQTRKRDTFIHPYLGEKIEIGLLPYVQAMLLARYLRGDLEDYPVFIAK